MLHSAGIESFGFWNHVGVAAISGAAVMTRVLSGYGALCIPETAVLIRGLGHPLVTTGQLVHTPILVNKFWLHFLIISYKHFSYMNIIFFGF